MTPQEALHTLDTLIVSFTNDTEPDFAGFARVNDAIEAMMPNLELDSAKDLWAKLDQLGDIITNQHHALESELGRFGTKRRAMKGYGHLRSYRKGQRIQKDV
jgi:hypothetical protein